MTAVEQNRLSELTHTLKFVDEELAKAEKELAENRKDPSSDMREVSQRYCLLVKERYRFQSALNNEVDKLMSFLE